MRIDIGVQHNWRDNEKREPKVLMRKNQEMRSHLVRALLA